MKWRHPHHWLRGYSDAQLGKPEQPQTHHDEPSYYAGYRAGGGDSVPAHVRWPNGAPT